MRLIDADELMKDRVENDPVRIAAMCAPTAFDKEKVLWELLESADLSAEDGLWYIGLQEAFRIVDKGGNFMMEIKYSDDVTLHVNITDQMVSDWATHKRLAQIVGGDGPDCTKCSLNIDMDADASLGLCEIPAIRDELDRRVGCANL